MSLRRGLATIAWAVVWAPIFWFGDHGDPSIVGTIGALFWIVGGCYLTATRRWNLVYGGLRWRAVIATVAYLVAAVGVLVLVVKGLDGDQWPVAVRLFLVFAVACPAVLLVSTWWRELPGETRDPD